MHRPIATRRSSAGFTLAELMISMAVGIILLAGMAKLFVTNSRAQAELEKNNRQVENGRYAIQALSNDLNNAGYYAEFDQTPLPNPGTVPDVCGSSVAAAREALVLPVHGVDNAIPSNLTCLDGLKSGTDVLVVRRVETCVLGSGNCAGADGGGLLFQASLCMNIDELGSGDATNHYSLDTSIGNLTRHTRQCTLTSLGPAAAVRRFLTHVYYIASNNKAGDGIPTLKRADLTATGGVTRWVIVPLVEGIENIQYEYGVDSDTGRDGAPNGYSANPGVACADADCTINAWRGVVAVKLNLLSRNTAFTPGHTDTKVYSLGLKADQTDNTVAAANDNYKRHVFQSTVYVPNAAGRRTP